MVFEATRTAIPDQSIPVSRVVKSLLNYRFNNFI